MEYENIEIDLDDFRHLVVDIQRAVCGEHSIPQINDSVKFVERDSIVHDSLMQIVKNSGLEITNTSDYPIDDYPLFWLDPFEDLNLKLKGGK